MSDEYMLGMIEGQGDVERLKAGPEIERVVAIMREEGEAIATVASDARSDLAATDCVYWLERAAEHMRRYAGWIEAARPPGPDVSRLLEACRVALGALMNGSTDTQRHAAFHHLRGALKAAEHEAAQPE